MQSKVNPKSRQKSLVVQQLPDEVLIYDLKTNRAVCLNHTAAFVWQQANGQMPVAQIAYLLQRKLKTTIDESVVWFALEQLDKHNLLEGKTPSPSLFAGMNRRDLITMLGKSAAIALPLVMMITAPTAAAAQSVTACRQTEETCGGVNNVNGTCCSGNTCGGNDRCCRNNGQSCLIDIECCSGFCENGCRDFVFGCVLWDTEITTSEGLSIRARDVVVGQSLLGVNCMNGETIAGRVKHVMERETSAVYSIFAENGAVVNCSPSHDLIEGFGDTYGKRAEQFKEGDPLLVFDRASQKIVEARTTAINYVEIYQPVLMFEMDTREHTFVSGGIISHNYEKRRGG